MEEERKSWEEERWGRDGREEMVELCRTREKREMQIESIYISDVNDPTISRLDTEGVPKQWATAIFSPLFYSLLHECNALSVPAV